MSEVGISVAVTPDSRQFPGGERMVEEMLRRSIDQKFPGVADVEIVWLWDEGFTFEGEEVPACWLAMATGQMP